MKISVAKKKTSKRWKPLELTWDEFVDKLRDPLRTGETVREYRTMEKADKDYAKESAGGFVGGSLSCGQRKTEYVTDRCLITLDADHARPGMWDRATMAVDYEMACYSTHSHTPESPRLRFILPTSRAMTPEEYPAIARKVASWLDIEAMDQTTYEIARLMYWPSCPKDGDYEFHHQPGDVLDVDTVLASYGPGDAWTDVELWPMAKREITVRTRAMKQAGEPTEKPGIVGLFNRTYDVESAISEFLPDVYEPCDLSPGRYTYLAGTTAGGAVLYNDGAFLYSNHATDPAGGMSCNAFDLVRIHKFGDLDADAPEDTTVSKLPSFEAMSKWASDLPDVKRQRMDEQNEAIMREFGEAINTGDIDADVNVRRVTSAPAEAAEVEPDDTEEDTNWADKLEVNKKSGELEATVENALLILDNDPLLKKRIAYDLFSELPRIRGKLPWGVREGINGQYPGWTDTDFSQLFRYMQTFRKFSHEPYLRKALDIILAQNAFHPVRDYLLSLKWDGTERVDTLLQDYMGAEDTQLNRVMQRRWLVGAVARVFEPGCKFDNVLTLLGEQNLGKSAFARLLARNWFSDSHVDMNNKDGYAVLHGTWIQELGEMASVKKSDMETVKNFLTASVDKYRPSHERYVREVPRQNVFFGTTNEPEFLRDKSGNRRFWPIEVTKTLDQDEFEKIVDQVWAEVYFLYRMGEPRYLDEKWMMDDLEEVHKQHMAEDTVESAILNYLDTPIPYDFYDKSIEDRRDIVMGNYLGDLDKQMIQRDTVSVCEIRYELFGADRYDKSLMESRQVANIMTHLCKWKKSKAKVRVPGYGPQWVYRRIQS